MTIESCIIPLGKMERKTTLELYKLNQKKERRKKCMQKYVDLVSDCYEIRPNIMYLFSIVCMK